MCSSKFLTLSFLCIFCTTGLVAADPNFQFGGGNQFCESVQTVTVTKTVAPGQPSPSSRSANKPSSSPPAVTSPPGNVNLGNGGSIVNNTKTSSVVKNTKTSSVVKNTKTSSVVKNTKTSVVKNTKTSSVPNNTKTSSGVKNTQTPGVKGDTNVKNGNNNNTNTKNGNTRTSSVLTSSTALPPTSTGNPDASLTLNPSVIQNINGKAQAAGESDSLVSSNNFIDFCVGKTISNGKQVQGGSCDPTPMGDIPSIDKMPSAKFGSPKNFDTIPANTPFTISLNINNLATGLFTNAANTYYAAPQQLDGSGVIKGHSHVTVQQMASLDSPEPLNPKVFAFFKGLNGVAQNGALTADVTNGLSAGVYRIFSINSAGNHQEALGPVAQRGSFNDAIYITVADGGNNASSAVPPSSSGVLSSSISNPASSVSSSVVDSSTSPPTPSSTEKNGKGGKNTSVSSSELPVSTSTGGKEDSSPSSSGPPVSTGTDGNKGNKGGNVVSTPAPLPESSTPAAGNGKTDNKNPAVSSSVSPPDSTPTQGGNGKGGNKQNQRRMTKRSRRA